MHVSHASESKGGTWSGAVEALRRGIAPVLVWTGLGAGPGNQPLVDRGGVAVSEIDDLFALPISEPSGGADERISSQLSLKL